MGRNKSSYSINSKNQERTYALKNAESRPTDDLLVTNSKSNNLQNAKAPKVSPEKNSFDKFTSSIEKWHLLVTIIAAVLVWAIYLQYDVKSAKEDIEKNESKNNNNESKIIDIDKNQIGHDKEINFLKQRQDSTDNKLLNIEHSLMTIEIEHAQQNSRKRKN